MSIINENLSIKKETVISLQKRKQQLPISMLTCYDFQTAQLLNESQVDMILVGDSLGNVVLGEATTVSVKLEHMCLFGKAVRRGCPDKFLMIDMPFGTYDTVARGLKNAITIMQMTQAESIKIEGAFPYQCELIERLNMIGVPVMGHIGLRPQSIHTQGGYHKHGKDAHAGQLLLEEALNLEAAGAFAIILECIDEGVSKMITSKLKIPTVGIGSGKYVDGQVLVINDLFHMGKQAPPKFCKPIANLYEQRKSLLEDYIKNVKEKK